MYNLVPSRGGVLIKDYISVGERPLPRIYLLFMLLTVGFLLAWVWYCFKHRQHVHKIHHLMTAFMIVKALTLMS